jgi:hypothetical protein
VLRPETAEALQEPMHMTQQTMDPGIAARRKGVRRTVVVAGSIALVFFLVSFLQIVLMK